MNDYFFIKNIGVTRGVQLYRAAEVVGPYNVFHQTGAYFITICTINREPILSTITVGDGSAVPQFQYASVPQQTSTSIPHVTLSPLGQIVEEYIHMIPEKYPNIIIDTYVIMPDHIHMILSIVSHNTTHGRASAQ